MPQHPRSERHQVPYIPEEGEVDVLGDCRTRTCPVRRDRPASLRTALGQSIQSSWVSSVDRSTRVLCRHGWNHASTERQRSVSGQQPAAGVLDPTRIHVISRHQRSGYMGQVESRYPDQDHDARPGRIARDPDHRTSDQGS